MSAAIPKVNFHRTMTWSYLSSYPERQTELLV